MIQDLYVIHIEDLLGMYADVVDGLDRQEFEKLLTSIKTKKGVKLDNELDANGMFEVVMRFKALYKQLKGQDFPQDPKVQLLEAVKAVFRSWNNERAEVYRRMNNIPS